MGENKNTINKKYSDYLLLSNEEKPSNVSVDLEDISRRVYFDKTNHKIKTYSDNNIKMTDMYDDFWKLYLK